jgi:S-layer homology domain
MVYRSAQRICASVLCIALTLFACVPAWADDATAATAPTPPASDTQLTMSAVTPFADVPENHWAFAAIDQLAQDGYIKGYPDGKFKGARPMTRYEVAYLVSQAVSSLKDRVAQGQTAEQADIDALRKLLTTFGTEVADLQNRVARLESQTNALQKQADAMQVTLDDTKKEADATRTRSNATRVGILFIEKPGTVYNNVNIVNGGIGTVAGAAPGQTIRGGQGSAASNVNGTTYQFGPGGLNTSSLGAFDHGINYQIAKFTLYGQVDPRWSYYTRVTAKTTLENPFGATTASPAFCSTASITVVVNCSYQDLGSNFNQNTIAVTVEDALVAYSSPGGITAQVGRYPANSYGKFNHDAIPLIYPGGQISGASAGFNDPHNRVFGQVFYGLPDVSSYTLAGQQGVSNPCAAPSSVVGLNLGAVQHQYAGVNPNCNATQSLIGAWGLYYFPSTRTAIGSSYNETFNLPYAYYDASAVTCTVAGTARMAMSSALCGANGGSQTTAKAGNYVTAQGIVSSAEVYGQQFLGPRDKPTWSGQFAYARHLGIDPINGGPWLGSEAYSTAVTYASKGNLSAYGNGNPFFPGPGARNSNVGQLYYGYYGLNSMGTNSALNASTAFQNNLGFINSNGMQLFMAVYGHWFSDNFRISLIGIHTQNDPGVTIPVGTNGTPNTCAGCFVNSINQNELMVESYFSF